MAAATRALRTYRKSDGSPLVAEPIDATIAAELFEDDAIPGGKVNLVGDLDTYIPFELDKATTVAGDVTITVPRKCRIRGGQFLKTTAGNGAATGSATIKKGANTVGVITYDTAADKAIIDLDNIDDAHWQFDAGDTITITSAGTGDLNGLVTLFCKPIG